MATGGGYSGSGSAAAKAGTIDTFDFGFKPVEQTVKAGTTVKWENTGKQIHTVKQLPASKERFFSRALEAGQSYSHRFATPGTYPYFCTLHPEQMRATITVR